MPKAMPSSRIPSPARSQGARSTPRRYKPRASRSVCSPARSTTSVKLSAVVMSQMDFELSPLPTRRSVLADTTEIDAPRRHSWWKKLNENSREIMEALNNKESAEVNEVDELIEVDVPSQEKENCTFDLPESSDNESIRSIVIPQRMLFTQKNNQQQNKFAQIIDTRKSLTKLQKSHVVDENDLNVGPKNLFNHGTRNKPIFPSGLLNISANKTLANKTKEINANEVKGQVKSLFGSRPGTKRKNMFVDFIVSESDDEIPEIQTKVFEFQKATEHSQKPHFSQRNRRESSPTSITDIEIDEWRLLPSSTMVDHQLEDGLRTTPNKRTRLGKLSEGTESTANKTRLSNKSISMNNKSKNVSNFKAIEVNEIFGPTDNNELDGDMEDQNNRTRKSLRKSSTSVKNITHERSSRSQNRSLNKSKKNQSKSTDNKTTNDEQDKSNHNKGTEQQNREISHKVDTYNQEICDNQNNSGSNNADSNIEINQYKEKNSHKLIDINKDDEMQHNSTLKRKVNIDKGENRQITKENTGFIEDEEKQIDENALISEDNDHNDVEESKEETQDGSEESGEEICLRMEEDEEEIRESHIESKVEDEKDKESINDTDANDTHNMKNGGKTDSSDLNVSHDNVNGEEEKQVQNDEDQKASAEDDSHEVYNDEQEMKADLEKESDQNIDQETDIEEEEVQIEDEDMSEAENDELEDSNNRNVNEESDNGEDMQEDLNDDEDNNDRSNVSHEIKNDNKGSESNVEDDAQIVNKETHTDHDNVSLEVEPESAEEMEENDEDRKEIQSSQENVSQEVEPDSAEEMEEDDEDRGEMHSSQEVEPESAEEMEEDDEDGEEIHSSQENVSQEVEPESDEEIEEDNENNVEVSTQNDNEQNESQDEVDNGIANDSEVEDRDQSGEDDEIDKIEESSEVNEQDTTGRNRKKQSKVSSPEAVLQNKTNQIDSFTVQGRNTSVRKTKSMIKALNIRPSLAPRESTGFSDGTRDSSAEGSGWDSHRTTRVTLRKTLGKDFTPRKSLRALVMEKSAKRQTIANFTEANAEISKFPQANSTELPAEEPIDMQDDDIDDVQESDHEESRRQRQTTLELYLQKVKRDNMERRRQLQEEVKSSLKAPKKDVFNFFKVPAVPKRRAPLQTKPKAKPKTSSVIPLDILPPQLLEDMKYKPPKRYRPASASWITKRLYSFLETKLEPKYDYKARVRSEKLVEKIYEFTKSVRRHTNAPADAVNELKHEMARLQIVKTHFEFYEFFHEFMPREVRVKVVPDAFNNVPLPKHGVFSDILR